MDAPDDRLEVMYRQSPRVEASVPADDVEGVGGIPVTGEARLRPDEHRHAFPGRSCHPGSRRAAPISRRRPSGVLAGILEVGGEQRIGGPSHVPFGVRRPFFQLSPGAEIARRHVHVPGRLRDEHPRRAIAGDDPAVGGVGRHDHIVTRSRLEPAEDGLEPG